VAWELHASGQTKTQMLWYWHNDNLAEGKPGNHSLSAVVSHEGNTTGRMVLISLWLDSLFFIAQSLRFLFWCLQFLLPITPFLEEWQRYKRNMVQGHRRCVHGIGSLPLKLSVAPAHKKPLLDVQFASIILPYNCLGCLIPSWQSTWRDHYMPNTTTCFCLHPAWLCIWSVLIIFACILECLSKRTVLKQVSRKEGEL